MWYLTSFPFGSIAETVNVPSSFGFKLVGPVIVGLSGG